MEELLILIFVSFFATNSLEKAESVQLFDEIFGEGWWDNDKADEWDKLTLEHSFHPQIIRQNTQLGQIEPNSTDQLGQIEPNSTDQLGQIEPNSTDQNPPLTESDHNNNVKNGDKQNKIMQKMSSSENIADDKRKRKIVDKFHAMKDDFKQKGKFSSKEWVQIEKKIAKHLKLSRYQIYEWKNEFGLSRKVLYEKKERKNLVEKFDQRKAELKRAGFKNSYHHEIDETVAKELGLGFRTIYNWKRELGQTTPNHKHSDSEQKELMKRYYEIKGQNHKNTDKDIAKILKIRGSTLVKWKKQFKRQQFHPNSEHFVEEDTEANVRD